MKILKICKYMCKNIHESIKKVKLTNYYFHELINKYTGSLQGKYSAKPEDTAPGFSGLKTSMLLSKWHSNRVILTTGIFQTIGPMKLRIITTMQS